MTISKIEVWDFLPPFRDGPYAMSHVTVDSAFGRIYQVHTKDGLTGLGEVVFPPSVPRAQQLDRVNDEAVFLGDLIGRPAIDLMPLAAELRSRDKAWGGIGFGLETARYDLEAKRRQVPLSDLLGGAKCGAVPDYFSISERSPARISERVAEAGTQRTVFQIKLGVGDFEDDLKQVSLILNELTPEQIVLADANGGWSVERACETIARFDDPRIVWEEPCNTYEANAEVMRRSGTALMVDQCAASPEIVAQVIADGLAHSLCIKPAFLGGLSVAQQIRDDCVAADMKMRIDGPWCGDIATAAILHLALGAPEDLLIASCDLREPLVIEPDLRGVTTRSDTRVAPPAGIGISLPGNALGAPGAVYA